MSPRRAKMKVLKTTAVEDLVCRLCASRDSTFLDIFASDKSIAKKIDACRNMPCIKENDELPHMVCFRCSAKAEELGEFVNKAINTQRKLCSDFGITDGITKSKHLRTVWEEHLYKHNISNESLCESAVTRAIQNLKGLLPKPDKAQPSREANFKNSKVSRTTKQINKDNNNSSKHTPSLNDKRLDKIATLQLFRCDEPKRKVHEDITFSSNKPDSSKMPKPEPSKLRYDSFPGLSLSSYKSDPSPTEERSLSKPIAKNTQPPSKALKRPIAEIEKEEPKKPFNIMDHVSTIQINDVGPLYQCKLCDRNFVIKSLLLSHSCAKNGVSVKKPFINTNHIMRPDPPKIPKIKYINTKVSTSTALTDNSGTQPPKPKIGPASKVKRNEEVNIIGTTVKQVANKTICDPIAKPKPRIGPASKINQEKKDNLNLFSKLKSHPGITIKTAASGSSFSPAIPAPDAPSSSNRPYPVGLIQSNTNSFRRIEKDPPIFSVPPEKQQAYKIVKTGNPSKLLISTVKTNVPDTSAQPFRMSIGEATNPKKSQLFTFINCDSQLQPSYVLPTSLHGAPTVVVKDAAEGLKSYKCSLCNLNFNREQKLLAHCQTHYNEI